VRRPIPIVLLAPLLIGCGGSPGLSRSQAEAKARAIARTLAVEQQKGCHEKHVRVARVSCRSTAQAWSCGYSLSDGSGGLIKEPTAGGSTHQLTIAHELSVTC
jgi:hypothetical protein